MWTCIRVCHYNASPCDVCYTVDVCMMSAVSGPCNESITQYYYDYTEDRCVTFTYSGCAGNANRFSSIDECERKCLHGRITDGKSKSTHQPVK